MSLFGRIVVVTKRTPLQELLERFVVEAQAKFYLEHMGLSFEEYKRTHVAYEQGLWALRASLPSSPRHLVVERALLPTFAFDERDLLITLGGNGLVVNTAKYLDGQPIVAVNPDPERHESVLVPFRVEGVNGRIQSVLRGEAQLRQVTMAQATLNDGQTMIGFNDLFIGQRTHVSARYRIEFDGRAEDQSSSGVIVSTGAGSTGWIRSIVAGSLGVTRAICPRLPSDALQAESRFDWEADWLVFAVREPFPSKTSGARIVFGRVDRGHTLRIVSRMPEGGVIFSDGVEQDSISFNSGAIAEVGVSGRKANLVVG